MDNYRRTHTCGWLKTNGDKCWKSFASMDDVASHRQNHADHRGLRGLPRCCTQGTGFAGDRWSLRCAAHARRSRSRSPVVRGTSSGRAGTTSAGASDRPRPTRRPSLPSTGRAAPFVAAKQELPVQDDRAAMLRCAVRVAMLRWAGARERELQDSAQRAPSAPPAVPPLAPATDAEPTDSEDEQYWSQVGEFLQFHINDNDAAPAGAPSDPAQFAGSASSAPAPSAVRHIRVAQPAPRGRTSASPPGQSHPRSSSKRHPTSGR